MMTCSSSGVSGLSFIGRWFYKESVLLNFRFLIKMEEEKKHFLIDSLESHGTFFHRKCIPEVSNIPHLTVIEKEYPVTYMDKDTRIDIIARDQNESMYFIIECKKVDNEFKTWVFFQEKS